MGPNDPIRTLAHAFVHALNEGLPGVEYRAWTPAMRREGIAIEEAPVKTRRPYENEARVVMFPQSWGSTALGFGGVGGAAVTTAYTVVVEGPGGSAVYFDGRFAYRVPTISNDFDADLRANQMVGRDMAVGRYGATW